MKLKPLYIGVTGHRPDKLGGEYYARELIGAIAPSTYWDLRRTGHAYIEEVTQTTTIL